VTDWTTISALGTAGGTLVLAVATFASVRSANRAARAAERSLLAGLRPLLVPSRLEDSDQKVYFAGGAYLRIPGGRAVVREDEQEKVIYLAASLRNAGTGLAVLHGWRFYPRDMRADDEPDPAGFTPHTRDLYVPAGDAGFWQAAFRDPAAPAYDAALQAIKAREPLTVDLLYGDFEGGQRVITRFVLRSSDREDTWISSATHHWNVDRPSPR
jgi:hypothetical protein